MFRFDGVGAVAYRVAFGALANSFGCGNPHEERLRFDDLVEQLARFVFPPL